MPSTLSPDHLARQAERELKAAANVRTARQAKFYFKPGEEVWLFGVDTPTQRRIAGGLFQRVRGGWGIGGGGWVFWFFGLGGGGGVEKAWGMFVAAAQGNSAERPFPY